MKKILKIAAVAAMVLGCSACSQTQEEESSWQDQLIEENTLIVGISPDYPPYESLENGEMVGFDVDMMAELEKYLGVNVEFEQMTFSTIVDAVNLGQVDVGVSGFTYDPERQVLFSDPYLESAQVILTKKDSGIESVADLSGKVVGAQLGTTGADAAAEIEGASVELNQDANILVEALKAGQMDAVVVDLLVAQNYEESDSSLVVLDEPLVDEENGIICSTSNELLMDALNDAIAQFKESDAYEELKTKWGM